MFNVYSLQKEMQVRHGELIQEAEQAHLIQQIKSSQPYFRSPLTWQAGYDIVRFIKQAGEKIYVSQYLWPSN